MSPLHILALAGALIAATAAPKAHAQALEPGQFRSNGGALVWEPSTIVGKRLVGQAVWEQAKNGGVTVAETGSAALRGGQVTMTATRAVSGAAVLRGASALFGGPFGVAIALAPAVAEWIAKDKGQKVRINEVAGRFEILEYKEAPGPVSSGLEYSADGGETYHPDPGAACSNAASKYGRTVVTVYGPENAKRCVHKIPANPPYDHDFLMFAKPGACPAGWYITPAGCREKPEQGEWLPASLNDIAPYMYNHPMPADIAKQVAAAGIDLQGEITGITGPTSVAEGAPVTNSQPVNVPPEQSSNRTVAGNPYNLPANTPTVTGRSTGSTPINVDGSTVNAPNSSTTTSTYNPGSNTTSSETKTTHDPLTKNTTTNTTTNITYNTTNATARTTNNTNTTIINNVTNNVIHNSTTNDQQTPGPDEGKEEGTPTDANLPAVPRLYERKYPNGIKGIWDGAKTQLSNTALFKIAGNWMPSNMGGSCPKLTVPLSFATWADYGVGDFSPPCEVWGYGGIIIVVSSLLLARRLVFGG